MDLRCEPGQASTLSHYNAPSHVPIPPNSQEEKEHSNPQGKAPIERRTSALFRLSEPVEWEQVTAETDRYVPQKPHHGFTRTKTNENTLLKHKLQLL